MQFKSGVYDVLKALALVWLPAAGTLYFALSGIWGLPDPEQVIGTITAVDTFLGVGLHLSSKSYMPPAPAVDGHLIVDDTDPGKTNFQIEVHTPPEEMKTKPAMVLKVVHPNLDSPPIPGPHGG